MFLRIFLSLLQQFHLMAPKHRYKALFHLKELLLRFLYMLRYIKYSPAIVLWSLQAVV
jgi:hypothetical protein